MVDAILPIMVRQIDRSGEHIGIPPLTFKKTKLSKENALRDHYLNCISVSSFEEFTILANRNNKFVFKIKKTLLIKQDMPILNKIVNSAKFFFFVVVSFLIVSLYSNIVLL